MSLYCKSSIQRKYSITKKECTTCRNTHIFQSPQLSRKRNQVYFVLALGLVKWLRSIAMTA